MNIYSLNNKKISKYKRRGRETKKHEEMLHQRDTDGELANGVCFPIVREEGFQIKSTTSCHIGPNQMAFI